MLEFEYEEGRQEVEQVSDSGINPVQQISARFTHLVDHDRTVNMQCCWANAYAYANMLMGVGSVNDGQFYCCCLPAALQS